MRPRSLILLALSLILGLVASTALNPHTAAARADSPPPQDEPYDLLITGGRIVDGTGNPWFYGDLAVRGDRIAAIGHLSGAKARRTIDATGLIVAPGFIDMHSHSDYLLLEDGHAQSKIRQGVTTDVLGEGSSGGPYKGELSPRSFRARGTTYQWSTLGEYLDTLEKAGIAINVVSYVGLNNIRRCVLGDSFDQPTAEQLESMKALVDEAMRDGAFGLSSQVMMPPGSLATTDEIVALCTVVRRHGGI
jgi:N-acyl-D-amino-acid deacylase